MEIAFKTRKLRDICEDDSLAENEYGSKVAKILKHRLADFMAGMTFSDFVVGNPRPLTSNVQLIDLCDGFVLEISANHTKNPLLETGEIDWSKVRRIKVLNIRENHE